MLNQYLRTFFFEKRKVKSLTETMQSGERQVSPKREGLVLSIGGRRAPSHLIVPRASNSGITNWILSLLIRHLFSLFF